MVKGNSSSRSGSRQGSRPSSQQGRRRGVGSPVARAPSAGLSNGIVLSLEEYLATQKAIQKALAAGWMKSPERGRARSRGFSGSSNRSIEKRPISRTSSGRDLRSWYHVKPLVLNGEGYMDFPRARASSIGFPNEEERFIEKDFTPFLAPRASSTGIAFNRLDGSPIQPFPVPRASSTGIALNTGDYEDFGSPTELIRSESASSQTMPWQTIAYSLGYRPPLEEFTTEHAETPGVSVVKPRPVLGTASQKGGRRRIQKYRTRKTVHRKQRA